MYRVAYISRQPTATKCQRAENPEASHLSQLIPIQVKIKHADRKDMKLKQTNKQKKNPTTQDRRKMGTDTKRIIIKSLMKENQNIKGTKCRIFNGLDNVKIFGK